MALQRGVRAALMALGCVAAATGCPSRPKPGEACRVPDQLVCAASNRGLVCDPPAGSASAEASTPAPRAWTEVACKGARGCARAGDDDACDDTVASEGDPCPRSPPLDYACGTDHGSALVCHDGRFSLWRRCRGPEGCRVLDGRNVHCDTSLGEAGDPCERPGTFACSVEGNAMLECDGKALSLVASCKGAKGCFFEHGEPGAEPHKVECDDKIADDGDPCMQDRRITCATDHKSELVCDGHKFAKKRDCAHADCRVEGTELFCD